MTTKNIEDMKLTNVDVSEVKEHTEFMDSYSDDLRPSRKSVLEAEPESAYDKRLSIKGNKLFFIPVLTPMILYYEAWNDEDENEFAKKSLLKLFDLQITYLLIAVIGLMLAIVPLTAVAALGGVYALLSLYSLKKAKEDRIWNPLGTIGDLV